MLKSKLNKPVRDDLECSDSGNNKNCTHISRPIENVEAEGTIYNLISDDFKNLYFEYFPAISRFIWLRVNSIEMTKDLVQEVFLKLWQTRERLDPEKSIKAYIYRIAHNLVIDYLRKQKSRNKYIDNIQSSAQAEITSSVELSTALKLAINNLPENLRTVFLLGRYQGLQYKEIAEVCNISYKTVVVRMNKALQLLRKELS